MTLRLGSIPQFNLAPRGGYASPDLSEIGNAFFGGYDQARERTLKDLQMQAEGGIANALLASAGGVPTGGTTLADIGQNAPSYNTSGKTPTFAGIHGAGNAIAGIESGGRYDSLGPIVKNGDRAYGKYQVMGANIPAWTRQYVGREMTPQEFLSSPEAQEAVFKGEFGRLAAKHGPEGAARAWFAGEGGMNDMGRRDILGTSVADYSRKFQAAGGGADAPAPGAQNAQFQIPGQASPASPAAQLPPHVVALLRSNNPFERRQGIAMAQQYMKPTQYGFQTAGDTLYRTDPRTGMAVPIQQVNKPTSDIQNFEYGQRNPAFSQQQLEMKRAGATTIRNEGNIPPGYQVVRDAQGNSVRMEPVPGSPAALEAEAARRKAEQQQSQQSTTANIVTQDIDRALKLVNDSWQPTTGGAGSALSGIGGTAAHDLKNLVETIRTNVAFDKLQQMRAASPTGGALGAVSDRENSMLGAALGSLEQSQRKEQFIENLKRVKNILNDIVHGPGQGPSRERLSFEQSAPASAPSEGTASGTTKSGIRWSVQ